jgi:hypothetical protein
MFSRADQKRLVELLAHRPVQFCLFLCALVGEEQMEQLMTPAIREARAIAERLEQEGKTG